MSALATSRTHRCCACSSDLPQSSFSKNQLQKRFQKRKCISCASAPNPNSLKRKVDDHPTSNSPAPNSSSSPIPCISCKKQLSPESFSSSQRKRTAKRGSTCKPCVAKSLANLKVQSPATSRVSDDAVQVEDVMDRVGVKVYLVENGMDKEKRVKRREAYSALTASLTSACDMSMGIPMIGKFVGVDCEGNDGSGGKQGSMMVQVSSGSISIVEALTTPGRGISKECREIMLSDEINKVFCDAKSDVDAINADMREPIDYKMTGRISQDSIKDVQKLCGSNGKARLGLAQVITCATGIAFVKQSFKKKQWWRLSSAQQMIDAKGFVKYAAGDAWGTWLAYHFIAEQYGRFTPLPLPLAEHIASKQDERLKNLVDAL